MAPLISRLLFMAFADYRIRFSSSLPLDGLSYRSVVRMMLYRERRVIERVCCRIGYRAKRVGDGSSQMSLDKIQ